LNCVILITKTPAADRRNHRKRLLKTMNYANISLSGRSGGIGRRTRLKIVRPPGMWVQLPPSAPEKSTA
jgi:hypothetical protein